MPPELRARSDADAPRLEYVDGRVVLHADGESTTFPPAGRPGAPAALTTYRTDEQLRGSLVRRSPTRHGLRLEDSDGAVLAWLANADVEVYPRWAVAQFATQAGLELKRDGWRSRDELRTAAPDHTPSGAGTGSVSSRVAGLYQWSLAAVVGGGFCAFGGLAAGLWTQASGSMLAVLAITVFVGGCGCAAVGPWLGIMTSAWRELIRRRRYRSEVLTAAAGLGVVVTTTADGVQVYDPFDQHSLGTGTDVRIQPYRLRRGERRRAAGVMLTGHGVRPINIPARYSPEALRRFCEVSGIRLLPETSDAAIVPPRKPRFAFELLRLGGNSARVFNLGWLVFGMALVPLVGAAGPALLVLGLLDLLGASWHLPAIIAGAGMILVLLGGYGASRRQVSYAFGRPELIAEPVRLRP